MSTIRTKPWYWHVAIETTKVSRLRFATAMLEMGFGVCPGAFLMSNRIPLGRGVDALLVVQIAEGQERAFFDAVQPIEMTAPPRVSLAVRPDPPDDGHPGRHHPWPFRNYHNHLGEDGA